MADILLSVATQPFEQAQMGRLEAAQNLECDLAGASWIGPCTIDRPSSALIHLCTAQRAFIALDDLEGYCPSREVSSSDCSSNHLTGVAMHQGSVGIAAASASPVGLTQRKGSPRRLRQHPNAISREPRP